MAAQEAADQQRQQRQQQRLDDDERGHRAALPNLAASAAAGPVYGGTAAPWTRQAASWRQVRLSTSDVQEQSDGNRWHGFVHVIMRQTTSVILCTWVLHWPYRNTLQQVDRCWQEPSAHEQPCGQLRPGRRLQST